MTASKGQFRTSVFGTCVAGIVATALCTSPAGAAVRVFVTPSSDGYGLTVPGNAFEPTGGWQCDYTDGFHVCNVYPPSAYDAGTCQFPVTISESEFGYIWLRFESEPLNRIVTQLQIEIRECGQTVPASVTVCYYVQNDYECTFYRRWDVPGATPPGFPEYRQNPQPLAAVQANGIQNRSSNQAWNMYQGTTRTCLLGAIDPEPNKVYEIKITWIQYSDGSSPTVAGGAFGQQGGACCFGDTCTMMTNEVECWMQYGYFLGYGTDCEPNPCVYGACCYPGGSCSYDYEVFCTGTWLGPGASCYPNPCPQPQGACCQPDGSCAVTPQAQCSGTWLGAGSVCTPNPCPQPGACCFPDGSCDVKLQAQCNGTWLGAGSVCDPNPCPQPPGACCYPDGSCDIKAQAECTGTWLGSGSVCDPNPCPQPPGACCQADGSCFIAPQSQCTGTWLGYGSVCDPNPCPQPPTGACCLPQFACEVVTASACNTLGGNWLGANTTCDQCAPAVCRGDCDCDGLIGFSDIDFFVAAIPNNEAAWRERFLPGTPTCSFENCDLTDDGNVGFDDIDPFVAKIPSSCP